MGLGVILDVYISLSPDAIDVLADFVVIPCTSPLLLGAPFMETYTRNDNIDLCPTYHRLSGTGPPYDRLTTDL